MSNVQHKQTRPGNRNADDRRLKLHLRLLNLNGSTWRLLTLRPGAGVAFSTNYFHETWHLISDEPGARLLARIFWGLSYQRESRTMFLMHGENIKPTPFEAEPSLPFVICPANLTAPDPQAFRELKRLLPRLPNPTATVRLQTWGLDEAAATDDRDERHRRAGLGDGDDASLWQRERMTRQGGIICYTAPPAILRNQAGNLARMQIHRSVGQTYHDLAATRNGQWSGGEVQLFSRYRAMLSEAEEARREVVTNCGSGGRDETVVPPSVLQEAVWDRVDKVAARRQKVSQARRSRPRG